MTKLTAAFLGSGHFAARCLELISGRLRPEWVLTNAPRGAGRGLALRSTPVWELAQKLGLPAYTTERLSADAERVEWIKANAPDVLLVIDFGHIIKEPLLTAAKYGCLNIHPSKLPEYRGSAPLQRALMDGRASTAVSIFRLDAGMDSGPILAQPELEIAPDDDFASLAEKAAKLGAETLLHYLCDVPPDEWRFTAQSEEGATYAPKIDKAEGKIDWTRPAAEIADKIRGIGAAPGVFCAVRGKRLRIYRAEAVSGSGVPGTYAVRGGVPCVACGEGLLRLAEVQPEGKKLQRAEDWARGLRVNEGESLE